MEIVARLVPVLASSRSMFGAEASSDTRHMTCIIHMVSSCSRRRISESNTDQQQH